jgi:hypothetical protein
MELKWFSFPRGEAFAVPTEWREAFSLPIEWWIEAGMDRFEPGADLSYSARPLLASDAERSLSNARRQINRRTQRQQERLEAWVLRRDSEG